MKLSVPEFLLVDPAIGLADVPNFNPRRPVCLPNVGRTRQTASFGAAAKLDGVTSLPARLNFQNKICDYLDGDSSLPSTGFLTCY